MVGTGELKPCPFCGGEAELTGFGAPEFWVRCQNCDASTDAHTCKGGAIEAWNMRYEPMMDAIPMTEENMRKHGWVRERTCKRITLGLEREREVATVSWICSACGKHIDKDHEYCHNCGAKVVSE